MRGVLMALALVLAGCGGDASECGPPLKCDDGVPTEAVPGRPTEKRT